VSRPDAPAVSVVIATYQRREQVRSAVESVLEGTLEDFECIVVDDGSTDGTGEELVGIDPRVRYLWEENRGPSAARNLGIRLAGGDVVAFLDSDNRWLPNHLDVLGRALGKHRRAVAVSTCPGFRIGGRAQVEDAEVVDLLAELLLSNNVGYLSCVAVRRDALLGVGGFDERLPVWEDSDLWLRLAMLGPFCLVPHRTIVHRFSSGGLKELGIRRGEYLAAMALSAEEAIRALEERELPDTSRLLDLAHAKVDLIAGVQAAIRGDRDVAREALGDACRRAPHLSRAPAIVVGVLRHAPVAEMEFAEAATVMAAAWPDPGSDTARFLWMYGGAVATEARRPRRAVSYVLRANPLAHPSFLLRSRELTAHLLRMRLHERYGAAGDDQPGAG
jgi:hypothetical protein